MKLDQRHAVLADDCHEMDDIGSFASDKDFFDEKSEEELQQYSLVTQVLHLNPQVGFYIYIYFLLFYFLTRFLPSQTEIK